MDKQTRAQLEANGWRLGSVAEFLDCTPEESAFVEIRLALADHLRRLRTDRGWTQTQTAAHLGSSQSRVAKMEAADRSVSLDLLVKALLALGASATDIGRVIAAAEHTTSIVPSSRTVILKVPGSAPDGTTSM